MFASLESDEATHIFSLLTENFVPFSKRITSMRSWRQWKKQNPQLNH